MTREIGLLFVKSLRRQPSREDIGVSLHTCIGLATTINLIIPVASDYKGSWARISEQTEVQKLFVIIA